MNPPLHLRLLTRADLPFADSLRALAGWNQTPADWERFLALEPDGCFLAEWNGAPAGTATTIVYGPELAWIGMVLVHPDHRRRGIGRALLNRCLDYLRGRGVRCIKLDATPDGQRVYDGLGFKSEWTLKRWERAGVLARATVRDSRIRNWQGADLDAVERFDAKGVGVSRRRLIETLVEQSLGALVWEAEPGRIAGYGLLRPGSRALHLGPVVAGAAEVATRLIEALIEHSGGKKIIWDIPDQNTPAVKLAEQHGFIAQRPLTRMHLGQIGVPGDPQKVFGIAGPEVG